MDMDFTHTPKELEAEGMLSKARLGITGGGRYGRVMRAISKADPSFFEGNPNALNITANIYALGNLKRFWDIVLPHVKDGKVVLHDDMTYDINDFAIERGKILDVK